MKKVILIGLITFFFVPNFGECINSINHSSESNSSIFDLQLEELISLDKNKLETKLGRKLKFKERIALNLIKKKRKKQLEKNKKKSKQKTKLDGFAIAGFSASLIGLFGIGITPIGIIFGILGYVLGLIALKRIKRNPDRRKGKWFAIIGLLISTVILAVLFVNFLTSRIGF